MKITIHVENLQAQNAEAFEKCVLSIDGVTHVDTWIGKAEVDIRDSAVEQTLRQHLTATGFTIRPQELPVNEQVAQIYIDGMTCRSCEIIVEREFSKLSWVKKVDVNAAHGTAKIVCNSGCPLDLNALKHSLASESKYIVRGLNEKKHANPPNLTNPNRPSVLRLIGIFAIVLLVSLLFSKFNIFGSSATVGGTMTFAAALILGLVAGTSSCLAVSGGLLLSSAGKFHERYGSASPSARMRPVILFVTGRILSYGILGGLIGLLGTALTFSPIVTGALTLLAAAYMIVMGFEMLNIAPVWMKNLMPRMPKAIGRKIVNNEGKEHWSAPMLIGAATFFLPCGFSQSLQLYALTTGSFITSGLVLAGFAIGTAPALLALGWASTSIKGKAGKFFFEFAGALVIILGLFNIQNGLTIAGYPLSIPKLNIDFNASAASDSKTTSTDPNVFLEDGVQVIRMELVGRSPYYSPSDTYTVKAGTPVRIEIDGVGMGCRSIFQIPKLGVSTETSNPPTMVEFTPDKPGQYAFSCSMGMYRGTLNVAS